jgi:signal transduction histidine kinase
MSRWLTAAAVGLAACALLMGPVLLFGAFTLRTSLEDLNVRSDRERQGAAALAATLVGRTISAHREQLRVLSGRNDFRDALAHRDSGRLSDILAPIVTGVRDIATAGVLDPAGKVIARFPVDPAAIGLSLADRDYYAGALRSEGVFFGDAVTSRIDPTLSIVTLSVAVREGTMVQGIAILTVKPTVLTADLQAELDAPGREFLLIDHHSATIASTAKRPMLSPVDLPARAGQGLASLDGVARPFVAARIEGADWTLYVLDDSAYVYAAQRELETELGLPLAAAIVVSGVLAALLATAWLLLMRGRERLADANVRLLELNAEVQAATHAKSDFLANMSHELRTPLNAILGFSGLLTEQLEAAMTERQKRFMRNIRESGEHLLELINDVLDLSKVEAGKLELRPEIVSLEVLLEPVEAAGRNAAMTKGIAFSTEATSGSSLFVDATRVRQILLNLVSNAVKFTPDGGAVTLRARTEETDLLFEVADNGIGIPSDARDRVFGVFERLHEQRNAASGTGLGLALTKRLVEQMRGRITFDSAEGGGTTFSIRLPDAVTEPLSGERIVVVEDERHDADLIVAVAASLDLRAEVVRGLAGTDEALRRGLPLGVVLDLRLPDGRGEDFLRKLKGDPGSAEIPVIVVTVEAEPKDALALGADDYLTKPIDRARLERWMRRLVREDGRGTGSQARRTLAPASR